MSIEVRSVHEPGWLTPSHAQRIRSQMVRLHPGEESGRHTTTQREEVLLVLKGTATVQGKGGSVVALPGSAVYIAPEIEHNVQNQGPEDLEYVYVVALH